MRLEFDDASHSANAESSRRALTSSVDVRVVCANSRQLSFRVVVSARAFSSAQTLALALTKRASLCVAACADFAELCFNECIEVEVDSISRRKVSVSSLASFSESLSETICVFCETTTISKSQHLTSSVAALCRCESTASSSSSTCKS